MPGLFSSAIVAVCLSAQGNYNEACNKAVDAGTRQIGFRQSVDEIEEGTVKAAEAKLNKPGKYVLSAALFSYKTVKDKKAILKLPTLGICDGAQNEITKDSYLLKVKWNF